MEHTNNPIGICQWSMPEMKSVQAAATLRELGLDGIELDSGAWDGTHLALSDAKLQNQWQQACKANSLHIPALGVNPLCDYGMSNPDKAQIVTAILAAAVEIAHAMKIPALQLPSFVDGEMKTDQDIETTALRLQEVCDLARPLGIVISTENALTAEACLRLITLVNRENMKVFFDTLNPWSMEKLNVPTTLAGQYAHLHSAAHLKDGLREKRTSTLLGAGDSSFDQTMAIFAAKKYAGWFILENNYNKIPEVSQWKANVKKDIVTIKRAMQG